MKDSAAKPCEIINYLRVSERVGTGGQPTREQFESLSQAGYRVIINLATADALDALPNEREIVAPLGLDYVHLPIVWDYPRDGDLDQFIAAMDRCRQERVFIHCARNLRVSACLTLYRLIRGEISTEELEQAFTHFWEPNLVWRHFINQSLQRNGIASRFSFNHVGTASR